MIKKALVIDEPWISKILNGDKVWEMRSTQVKHRGLFGLIRKGSGKVVGVANLNSVSGPYDNTALAQLYENHKVGPDLYESPDYKWRYAWQLRDIESLEIPVNYKHKNGAVTWVELNDEAIAAIKVQIQQSSEVDEEVSEVVDDEMVRLFGNVKNTSEILKESELIVHDDNNLISPVHMPLSSLVKVISKVPHVLVQESLINNNNIKSEVDVVTSKVPAGVKEIMPGVYRLIESNPPTDEIIRITLTQGNINNSHFYIPRQTKIFPDDSWGGKNKHEAGITVVINFDGLEDAVVTDIDSSKRILRSRGAIRAYYSLHEITAGDELHISRLSKREYRISVNKITEEFNT